MCKVDTVFCGMEKRETSLVWNYTYADVEFGRVQARNMLQHLWTGPISKAAVDVVQGSKSVEVRPIGVSKDEDVYAYFDPELSFDRDHPCNNGKMEKGLDRRLSAKSCDRILSKSNKLGVLRTKTYPLISPDRNEYGRALFV